MRSILMRLAFVKITQVSFVLLISLLLVSDGAENKALVLSRFLDSLPLLVFGLVGGLLVDRFGAGKANRWALLVYIAPALLILGFHFNVLAAVWLALASMLIASTFNVLIVCNDRQVLDLIRKEELPRYNANAILIEQACTLAVPPLVGALAWWAIDFAIVVSTVLAICGAVALLILRPLQDQTEQRASGPWLQQLRDGFKTVTRYPFALQLSLIVMLVNGFEAIPFSYAIAYANDTLHMNAAEIGLLSSLAGLGGMLGATAARRIKGDRNLLLALFAASILLNATIHAFVFLMPSKYVLYICTALRAFSFVFTAVPYRSLRQESIDKKNFGTVSGALGFVVKAAMPVSILTGGALMIAYGPPETYLFAAIAELALVVGTIFWIKRQWHTVPLGASA